MSNVLLKFQIRLESPPIKSGAMYVPGLYGPQFYRWLPDGEKDAITLDTGEPNVTLKVWFERRGFTKGNIIQFDYERQEVDPEVMSRQGKLDAGPLIGLLGILDISDKEVSRLREKKIIKLFYPPVNKFLGLLRAQYGQYWISEIENWDSRKESASSYLRRFGFPRWSLDGGKTWEIFASTDVRLSVGELRKQQDYSEYLTKDDWQEIPKLLIGANESSSAASIMVEAVELFDQGYIRSAIINAVTALEIALDELFQYQVGKVSEGSLDIKSLPFYAQIAVTIIDDDEKAKTKFSESRIRKRFTIMATLLKIPQKFRNDTHKIIKLRNDMVHKGKTLPDDIRSEFSGFLNAFVLLHPDQRLRFPMAHSGVRLMTQEDWEQLEEKKG